MAKQALFAGLVYDEQGNPAATTLVGDQAHYVVDDNGFRRHVSSEVVDRQVLEFFIGQLMENRDLAVQQALTFLGKDDLFTKVALDASIRNINVEQIIEHGVPEQARDMMGMVGLRIIINHHGEVVRLDQPAVPDDS